MELTSQHYWEDYYKASAEDRETIVKVCGAYDPFWKKFVGACQQPPASILEIGAFPGRYLAYLSNRFSVRPTGIDFNPDQEKFARSLRSMGVDEFDYICTDFLAHVPSKTFDLVFSNGFIEHFTNFDEVLDMHVAYLKEGGAMMVMIPNKRFLRSLYGSLVDRKNQKAHNLRSMKLSVFREFAERNGLVIDFLDYYGGFPFKVHSDLNPFQKVVYHLTRFVAVRLQAVIRRHPSKWWSSAIICICHRPTGA